MSYATGEMMHTQKIAPVTLKRAEIKTQSGTVSGSCPTFTHA